MPSWTSSESRVISGRVEYFCKCSRQLTLQTAKTRKNPELLYGMLQKHKQLKKHVDYDKLINVLAMDKSMLEEELRATKSKLKLYDRLFFIMLGYFSVVCVGFGMLIGSFSVIYDISQFEFNLLNACCKCKLQSNCKLQMLAAKQMQSARKMLAANATCKYLLQMLAANTSYKCLQQSKYNLQMLVANACCKCNKQMQVANAYCKCNIKANATSKCKLQMLAANATCKCNV
ncbi:hypothetical protein Tco_1452948 [Tanacetum coccineum]